MGSGVRKKGFRLQQARKEEKGKKGKQERWEAVCCDVLARLLPHKMPPKDTVDSLGGALIRIQGLSQRLQGEAVPQSSPWTEKKLTGLVPFHLWIPSGQS